MHRLRFTVLVLAILTIRPGHAYEGAQYPTAQSLETVVTAFVKDVVKADGPDLEQIVKGILPSKEDMAALMPKYAEQLSIEMGAEEVAKALKQRLVTRVVSEENTKLIVVNCREESEAEDYREVLALLPDKAQVFRVVWTNAQRANLAEMRTFIYVNERWVWSPLFTGLPQALKNAAAAKNASPK